jgi:hypothetical protein
LLNIQAVFQAAIVNSKHLGLSIRQAIAESSRGDRCVIRKLKGSGFNGDYYNFSVINFLKVRKHLKFINLVAPSSDFKVSQAQVQLPQLER